MYRAFSIDTAKTNTLNEQAYRTLSYAVELSPSKPPTKTRGAGFKFDPSGNKVCLFMLIYFTFICRYMCV